MEFLIFMPYMLYIGGFYACPDSLFRVFCLFLKQHKKARHIQKGGFLSYRPLAKLLLALQ